MDATTHRTTIEIMSASEPVHTPKRGNVYNATRRAMHQATTDARFDTIDVKLDAVVAKIDDLGRRMDERFEQVDKRFDGVDRRFQKVEDRLLRLYQTLLAGGFAVIAALLATQL